MLCYLSTTLYGWDAVGNRSTVTNNGTAVNYTTNQLNQYNAVGSRPLTYNGNGDLKTMDGWTYTYDAQDRLIKAEKGSTVIILSYDPRNRCVKRVINNGAGYLFYYDNWNLLEEYNTGGALLNTYTHGAKIDELLMKKPSGTGALVYYQYDALGNVTNLTDRIGRVVEKYSYDIFGKPTIRNGSGTLIINSVSAYGNRFMFTGREYIKELKLYDYRNRFYSDSLGRFLQTDLLRFEADDVNLYRYVRNNPVNQTDALGLLSTGGKDPGLNTIVCDGSGGIRVQLGNIGGNKCLADCAQKHEEVHIADALAINKDICKGKEDGICILWTPEERKPSEVKASDAEIDCLKEKLKNNCPKECVEEVKARIKQMEAYRDSFK